MATKPTTIGGYYRQIGELEKGAATPAVFPGVITFSFDPTAASADTGKVLPSGCVPIACLAVQPNATGGTNPTVDIGTAADPDGFANEMDADGYTGLVYTGALLGTAITTPTAIYAGVGASAATGGTVVGSVWYLMADDGGFDS